MTVWLRFPFSCWLLTEALVAQTVKTHLQGRRPGFDPWFGKISWRRKSTSEILPGESHRQRRLVGYSSWGHKELVTTEWLSLHFTLQAYSSLLHCSLSRPAHVAGYFFKAWRRGTSLVVQWLKLCTPNAGGPGLIPCQGTRSHRLWLRVCRPQPMTLHTTTKTQHS